MLQELKHGIEAANNAYDEDARSTNSTLQLPKNLPIYIPCIPLLVQIERLFCLSRM